MKLWYVGQSRHGETPNAVWDFQGVFSSEEKAIAACHGPQFFVVPVELDREFPLEAMEAPGGYYPKV